MQETISGYPSRESKRRLRLIVILLLVGSYLVLGAVAIAPAIPIIRGQGPRLEDSQRFFVVSYVILLVLLFILPTILGAILAGPMRRHRLSEIAPGINLAPLWRRGMAKAIDAMIIFCPTYVGQIMILLSFEPGMSRISDMPKAGLIVTVMGAIWAIPWLIVYIKSEAKTGRTPGKALLRLRVLNEGMQPCGIGPALLRNALGFIDVMFFGIVGVCFAALSVRWQRLGDLAGRTIVVQDTPE